MATDLRRTRGGQALFELAMGMFVLALVLSATFSFASYIVKSLDAQRSLRAKAGRGALNGFGGYSTATASDVVEVESFASENIFGTTRLKVRESVKMPAMGGL